jgi:NADPH:quinone reductase-like Zn-dependent oxidoreductase
MPPKERIMNNLQTQPITQNVSIQATMQATMQAIQYTQYGAPDVLHLADVPIPEPQAGEVLVQVHAASVNPLDWHLMRADPFPARLENGLYRPDNPFLGADLAGVVVAVGADVTEFRIGDEVFGDVFKSGLGALAEYACVPVTTLCHKPNNIAFAEAAAVPLAAQTALQGLRDHEKLQAGHHVLINGASGGVGTFAVQIAKAVGAHVTGVCSTRNIDLVKGLGADEVIDYTQDNFTEQGIRYDFILDMVGNHRASELQHALKPDGVASIVGFQSLGKMVGHVLVGRLLTMQNQQSIGLLGTVQTNRHDLGWLKEQIEAERITPVIDRCYPFAETAEAMRYLETSRARGKVIVQMLEPSQPAL